MIPFKCHCNKKFSKLQKSQPPFCHFNCADLNDIAKTASKTKEGIKRLFKADKAVGHFVKHKDKLMGAFGKNSYNLKDYMLDANHVINKGQYAKEMNGYIKIIGVAGDNSKASAAFVGLTKNGKYITTFHIKTIKEIVK